MLLNKEPLGNGLPRDGLEERNSLTEDRTQDLPTGSRLLYQAELPAKIYSSTLSEYVLLVTDDLERDSSTELVI